MEMEYNDGLLCANRDTKRPKMDSLSDKHESTAGASVECNKLKEWEEKIKTKKSKRVGSKHIDPVVLALRRKVQECCSRNDFATAIELYEDAITKSIRIEAQTFYNLLNLCDGLGDRGVHIGTPKPCKEVSLGVRENQEEEASKSEETLNAPGIPDCQSEKHTDSKVCTSREFSVQVRRAYAFRIKSHMDSLDLPLNETA